MAKPLRSDDPAPKSVQFSHFGPLNTGTRSKGAAITSILINGSIVLFLIVLALVAKKNPEIAKKVATLTLPAEPPPPPKPIPKPPPPPPKPLPKPPKIEEPKITPKPIPVPPEIKPIEVPHPKPVVITPPAPKKVDPPPAPKVVNLSQPHAASVVNHDANPSPVRLGNPEISTASGKPTAQPVNLGGGMHNMSPSNSGNGPRATAVNFGSGSPQGTNINGTGRGAVPVKGLITGVPGSNGTGPNRGPVAVQVGIQNQPQPVAPPRVAQTLSQAKPPVFTYKPKPVYTEDARENHVEGIIRVRIRVTSSGVVQFVAAENTLGHGLDPQARAVVEGMRAKPALNDAGQPTDWTGEIAVTFQIG